MKQYIVAISDDNSPSFDLLPPVYTVDNKFSILFHHYPKMEIVGDDVSCNFDYYIDFGMGVDEIAEAYFDDKYINIPRISKRMQTATIVKFNKTRDTASKIAYPRNYITQYDNNASVLAIAQVGVPQTDRVLIKHQFGARGDNQVIVPKHMLSSFLNKAQGKNVNEVQEMFPDLIYSKLTKKDTPMYPTIGSMYVCDFIDDVVSEWRIIISGTLKYVRTRTISNGDYPQANLDLKSSKPLEYTNLSVEFSESEVELIEDFITFSGLKYGSLDIYKNQNGDIGIFEYSNEYGIHAEDPVFIRKLLITTVTEILCDKRKVSL